jgi:hypothetical protein
MGLRRIGVPHRSGWETTDREDPPRPGVVRAKHGGTQTGGPDAPRAQWAMYGRRPAARRTAIPVRAPLSARPSGADGIGAEGRSNRTGGRVTARAPT